MFRKRKKTTSLNPTEYATHLTKLSYSGIRKRPTPYIGEVLDVGSEEDKKAYEKSKFFQVYLNQTRGRGFCFDEQEDTICTINTFDQPERGRQYIVSYNSLDLGKIEIRSGFDLLNEFPAAGELLELHFEFNRIEFLDHQTIMSLLTQLAISMMPVEQRERDHKRAQRAAHDILQEALWDSQHEAAMNGWRNDTTHIRAVGSFTGPAGYYTSALEQWRKNYDLLAEANCDGLPVGNKDR